MNEEFMWGRPLRTRTDLTPLQQIILIEAFEYHSLIDVLNSCVTGEDALHWNRKWKYVPEVSAATLALFDHGAISVGIDEDEIPNRARAREALAEFSNWWRFDDSDRNDPEEWAALTRAGLKGWREWDVYWLTGTPRGQLNWPDLA